MNNHREIFNDIYRYNAWGNGSGTGSIYENCKIYMQYLQTFLKHNNIKSVCDAGCGDWQFSKHMNWEGIEYIGLDVSNIVLENAKKHTAQNIKFLELNALDDELPKADLLIMKDVIQHWSNQDIIDFLPKLSDYDYCLITNGFPNESMKSVNQNIRPGGCRPVDLSKHPFNVNGVYVYWFFADEFKKTFLISNKKGLN